MEPLSQPEPPCQLCVARCCRQQHSGWPFATTLEPEEYDHFAEFAVYDDLTQAYVLPYNAQGTCPYLGTDNLCQIHDQRPQTCRDFNCGVGNIVFVSRNPELLELLGS